MKTPFIYRTGKPHEDERLRKAGWKLIDCPQAGDHAVMYYFNDSMSVIVKCHSEDHHRVSRWFNQQSRDFREHYFTFES